MSFLLLDVSKTGESGVLFVLVVSLCGTPQVKGMGKESPLRHPAGSPICDEAV